MWILKKKKLLLVHYQIYFDIYIAFIFHAGLRSNSNVRISIRSMSWGKIDDWMLR